MLLKSHSGLVCMLLKSHSGLVCMLLKSHSGLVCMFVKSHSGLVCMFVKLHSDLVCMFSVSPPVRGPLQHMMECLMRNIAAQIYTYLTLRFGALKHLVYPTQWSRLHVSEVTQWSSLNVVRTQHFDLHSGLTRVCAAV